ncbi:MAG: hypothetical protein Q8L87_19700 [Anaerolineales bacterium]|nr:hypothetical protein [Anaerolineales bacterium]
MKNFILTAMLFLCSSGAMANIISCNTSVDGNLISLEYDDDESVLYENYSFREIFFRGWGEVTCPAFITLRHLTPDLSDSERSVFCLNYDNEQKTIAGYTIGERNAYLECREPSRTFCERVNDSKDAAIAITGVAAGATGGATLATAGTGVTAVAHSSGAVILTGAGGYIAGTLASIGAGALAILTSPITITATAVSVVAVGGAVYICKE